MPNRLKKGDRVFMLMVHNTTGEEKRVYGTVKSDELPFWDYIDVVFDDAPGFTQPILGYYLYLDDQPEIKVGS